MISEALRNVRIEGRPVRYDRSDARLYALSLGFARDPENERELDFVVDRRGFRTVPTMAAVFADVIMDLTLACELRRPELALHGAQKLELFAPLPGTAELEVSGSISELFDRGEKRGAEIHMVAEARRHGEQEPLYRATYVTVARGDGGFGGTAPTRRTDRRTPPDREPDHAWESAIRPDQALLYALNGDPNPIHTQPAIARKAGFDKPILHGLCTYGMACRAILENHCNYDPDRIRGFDVRFSSPVFPGETLRVESWNTADGVRFQARVTERDLVVLKQGHCRL
jgi:acyl dehydratase